MTSAPPEIRSVVNFSPRLKLKFPYENLGLSTSFHHEDLARHSGNQISEYLAQRREGRKVRKITVNNFSKIIHLSLPNLACFAPWRESIPLFEYFSSMENLRM